MAIVQFTPEVSEADVERIIERDLAAASREEIRAIVRQLEVREKPRVVLACLKVAAGDVGKLKRNLAEARGYYREIIGEAEFPNYLKKVFRIEKLPEAEQKRIVERDRDQYLAWLSMPTGPK